MTFQARTSIALLLASTLLLGGCNVAAIGNVMVLFVSVGIFFGTLNLGRLSRTGSPGGGTAESSQHDR